MRKPNQQAIIELTSSEVAYFRITAINRFFDNVERALKGDKECLSNLLSEDLPDAREYYETVFRKIQQADWEAVK